MRIAAREQLLEREAEIAALEELIVETRRGEGRVVLIEGEAGIGKTRLLQAARESADDRGLRVLRARGAELEREFPYGLARQLFEPAIAEAGDADQQALLSGAAKAVEPLLAGGHALPFPAVGDVSFPILHGLYWLTANLAERQPLFLAVDDAHWGDRDSLRFLGYLVRRLEEVAVLLALTSRPNDPTAEIELIADIASDPAAVVVQPAPLSEAAVAALVESALGADPADEFCRACHGATGGNPFVLNDLLSELRRERIAPTAGAAADVSKVTPKALSRSVLLRLARLPAEAGRLAQATAILGDGAELREAAVLARLERDAASRAADALAGVGVLKPGRPLSFVHPLTRSAIYNDLAAGERSRAHESAAGLLAERGADPDEVAAHLLASEPAGQPETVELLRGAARRALERATPEAAVRYQKRAWSEPPREAARLPLLAELVTALTRAAVELDDELRGSLIAGLTSSPETLMSSGRELSMVLYGMGRPEDGSAILSRAVDAATNSGNHELALQLEVQRLQWGQALPSEIKARMEPYRELIEAGTPAERLWFAVEAWLKHLIGEDASEAATLARRALEGWHVFAEQSASPIPAQLIFVLLSSHQFDLAQRAIEFALAGATALGSAPLEAGTLGLRAELALRRGQVADAAADARTAVDIARAHHFRQAWPMYTYYIVETAVERGDLDEAERELELSGLAEEVPDTMWSHPVLLPRARLKLARGRARDALEDFLEAGRRDVRDGLNVLSWDSDAAVVLASLGDRDESARLAQRGVERARRWGSPDRIGRALRSLGLVTGGDRGLEQLREAVDCLRDSQAGLELVHALTDLGAALRRAGRRAEAREPLREALELARRGGALAIARHAHEELEATGEQLPRFAPIGVESLTPSERRVARLAADGLTNREIAQALFVTVKTVETHLGHAYQKLGIASRRELPATLEAEHMPSGG